MITMPPRVTAVAVHVLPSPVEQPSAVSQGWVRRRSATLVEVTTDTGITVRRDTLNRFRVN